MQIPDESTLDTSKTRRPAQRDRYVGLAILCHPEPARIGEIAPLFDPGTPLEHDLSRREPLFRTREGAPAAPLASVRVSRAPVRVALERDGTLRIEGSNVHEVFVDEQRIEGCARYQPSDLERGLCVRLGRYVLLWLGLFDAEAPPPPLPGLVGESAAMQHVRREVMRIATLDDPVLIRGETGTGKELIAAALHALSPRRQGPFVRVNMAAIPASTAAAELFGHGRGAFTGAIGSRAGYWRKPIAAPCCSTSSARLPSKCKRCCFARSRAPKFSRWAAPSAR